MARGKLMVAADEGKAIPLGWALARGQSHHGPQSRAQGLDAAGRRREGRDAAWWSNYW